MIGRFLLRVLDHSTRFTPAVNNKRNPKRRQQHCSSSALMTAFHKLCSYADYNPFRVYGCAHHLHPIISTLYPEHSPTNAPGPPGTAVAFWGSLGSFLGLFLLPPVPAQDESKQTIMEHATGRNDLLTAPVRNE